jgi:hypothetical protein
MVFARHSGAGRNPVAEAVGFRDNRTLAPLDPGLRRDDDPDRPSPLEMNQPWACAGMTHRATRGGDRSCAKARMPDAETDAISPALLA